MLGRERAGSLHLMARPCIGCSERLLYEVALLELETRAATGNASHMAFPVAM